jgi:hypothetical protein
MIMKQLLSPEAYSAMEEANIGLKNMERAGIISDSTVTIGVTNNEFILHQFITPISMPKKIFIQMTLKK